MSTLPNNNIKFSDFNIALNLPFNSTVYLSTVYGFNNEVPSSGRIGMGDLRGKSRNTPYVTLDLDFSTNGSFSPNNAGVFRDLSGRNNNFTVSSQGFSLSNANGGFLAVTGASYAYGPPNSCFNVLDYDHTIELVSRPTSGMQLLYQFADQTNNARMSLLHYPHLDQTIYDFAGIGDAGVYNRTYGVVTGWSTLHHLILRCSSASNGQGIIGTVIDNGSNIISRHYYPRPPTQYYWGGQSSLFNFIGGAEAGWRWYGDIYRFRFFNNALSDSQVQSLYQEARLRYRINTVPKLHIRAEDLIQEHNATISSWPGLPNTPTATGSSTGSSSLPKILRDEAFPYVRLGTGTDSTSNGNWFNFGAQTFSLATNGGMTVFAVVRKWGPGGSMGWAPVLMDFNSGVTTDNITIAQFNTTGNWGITYYNGSTGSSAQFSAQTDNQWQVIAVRYASTTATFINNAGVSSSGAILSVNNKSHTNTFVGKAVWGGISYANIDIREFMVFDRGLTDADMINIRNYLASKYSISLYSYPVTAMMGASSVTKITGQSYGNGPYVASASSSNDNAKLAFQRSLNGTGWTTTNSYSGNISQPGVLDSMTSAGRNACVAFYSFRLTRSAYTGPSVRIRRSTDNTQQDFYPNSSNQLTTGVGGTGSLLSSWLGAATGYVVTWYDQTGRGKHINQATTGSQPTIVGVSTGDLAIYYTNATSMSGSNVFDTTSVSDMHLVFKQKEIVRQPSVIISLNGSNNSERLSVHSPWSGDNMWHWDAGHTTNVLNRASSVANATVAGNTAFFSGYKSSTESKNAFRINAGTRYFSSQYSSAQCSGGIIIGSNWSTLQPNHYVYEVAVFNTKLGTSDESLLETVLNQSLGGSSTLITTTVTGVNYAGEWLQLSLPTPINLSKYQLSCNSNVLTSAPSSFVVAGSVDGINWSYVDAQSNITGWAAGGKVFGVTGTAAQAKYNTFRMIMRNTSGGSNININDWTLYSQESGSNNVDIVRNGLVAYLDPANPASYSGSGSNLINLVPNGPDAYIRGSFSFSSGNGGVITLNNPNTVHLSNNAFVKFTGSLSNVTTISTWSYQNSTGSTNNDFYIDCRPGMSNGWISEAAPTIGNDFISGSMFFNGGASRAISWSNVGGTIGSWRQSTVIANNPATCTPTIFGGFSGASGLHATFGPILIYSRTLTQSENVQNYHFFRSRYNLNM